MELTTRWSRRLLSALALALVATGGRAMAQYPPARPPAVPPASGRMVGVPGSPYSEGVRRVQATGDEALPPLPGASIPGTPGFSPSPDPTNAELALPAAERPFGGGEPTPLAADEVAAEEAAEGEETTPLVEFLGLEDTPYRIYGWIQNSFTGNPSFPADGINFGVTPNYKSNQWMGNQYYTVFERVMNRERFDIGGRFDFLFGNDWEFNKMRGVFDGAWPSGWFPGIDLAQFYGEMHLPVITEGGVDVKFGRWYTLHGYEVVPATGRPLLSVPYMFTYGQPFTHWGLMTTWNVSDQLVIYNGTPQGWDRFQNETARWGYMGGFSWTSKDEKLNLTSIYSYNRGLFPKFITRVTDGVPNLEANSDLTSNQTSLWTTVLSYQWTDKLTQVVETDQGVENGIPVLGAPRIFRNNGNWYSFGNWFLYEFDEKLTGVWRSEVFWDPNGIRTGFADRFYEMTLGLIYKPCPNLWFRPEARYDWSQFTHPYNGGVSDSQFTMAFDVILLY